MRQHRTKITVLIALFLVVPLGFFTVHVWNTRKLYILDFDLGWERLKLDHNQPETIQREILETDTVRLLAKKAGLSDGQISRIQVTVDPESGWVELRGAWLRQRVVDLMHQRVNEYIKARSAGHTRECLVAGIMSSRKPSTPALRALAAKHPLLPLDKFHFLTNGIHTNKAGMVVSRTVQTEIVNGKSVTNETVHVPRTDELCNWEVHTLSDGEVAWRYFIQFKPDGTLDHIGDSRVDSKEFDPRYAAVLAQVRQEVIDIMKSKGNYGKFGAVHEFWALKQQELKERNIVWRSPAELNPNTNFD